MAKFDPVEIFARNFDARTSDFEASLGWLGCELFAGDPWLEVRWWPKLAVIRNKLSLERVAELAVADTVDGKMAVLHVNGSEFSEGILAELRDISKAKKEVPEDCRVVLLSLRKDAAEAIIARTKTEEFRKAFPSIPVPFRVYAHVKGDEGFSLAFRVYGARPLEEGGFAWKIDTSTVQAVSRKLGDFALCSTNELPKAYPQAFHIAKELKSE